jgi:protein arginine kinase
MELEGMIGRTGEWLSGKGPESDIVISSRVRLARNLRGVNFMTRMDDKTRRKIESRCRKAIMDSKVAGACLYVPLHEAEELDRKFLVERHLISKEHGEGKGNRGVAIAEDEILSIMVLEEDHIRLQVFQSGMRLTEAWRIANQADNILENFLDYAFSPTLGYLTACPTNVGTGLRVSVMLHLPALVLTRHIEKIFQAVAKINLAVRGLYGEGTEATGHFYQISNQVALGRTEEDIVRSVGDVIPNIAGYERRAREELLKTDSRRLEDRIWRAYGNLANARILSSEESLMLLSMVRMGVHMEILKGLPIGVVNELFLFAQPAHLQKMEGREMKPEERDIVRADYIRRRLKEVGVS